MAMTFTLVTHLRERLSVLMREKEERIRKEEAEKERRALEVTLAVLRPPCRTNELYSGGGGEDSRHARHRRVIQCMEDQVRQGDGGQTRARRGGKAQGSPAQGKGGIQKATHARKRSVLHRAPIVSRIVN